MMAPGFGMSIIGMLSMFFMGGTSGMPLGMPPAEPDPMMARVAPEDVLFYLSWSAVDEADPRSTNHTERLLAEPEVQRFVKELIERIRASIQKEAADHPVEQKLAEIIPDMVQNALTSHTAIFVGSMKNAAGGAPPVGVVINLGEDAEAFADGLGTIQRTLMGQAEDPASVVDGIHTWPTPPFQPEMKWTIRNGYFVGGFGKGTLEQILGRMDQEKVPGWLTSLKKRLPVDRVSHVSLINTKELLEMAGPMIGVANPQMGPMLGDMGLNNLMAVVSATGFDEKGVVSRTLLQMDGRPSGLLGLLDAEPIHADDLKSVPADAIVAASIRIDPGDVLEKLLAMFERMEPGSSQEFDREMAQLSDTIGFSITEELFPAIGDQWTVYASPSTGGPLLMGATAFVTVRDHEALQRVSDTIRERVNAIQQEMHVRIGRRARTIGVKTMEVNGHTINFLIAVGEEMPVAPSWCVTEDKLVFALYPQYVAAFLKRAADAPSLATQPHMVKALKDRPPVGLVHFDGKAIFSTAYPLVMMGATLLCSELQREGVDIDVSLMPSGDAIARHMQPSVATLSVGDDGIEIYSERTLPVSLSPMPTMAVPWLFMARAVHVDHAAGAHDLNVAAAVVAPGGRQQVQSKNNLKQLIIAMHNYHATYSRLPAATPRDDNGESNLSWRVHLLPMLGQSQLYKEFKLDEAWDSPHNRKLIARMPKVFQTPGSKAGDGRTNYVVLRGEGTLFPTGDDDQKVGFRDVLDGTSYTIAIVEAADAKAVVWTKPDDLKFDRQRPKAGIVGLQRRGFLAALADGSVQFIPEAIPDEVMRRLVIRNDGKPVDPRSLRPRAVPPAGRTLRAVPQEGVRGRTLRGPAAVRPVPGRAIQRRPAAVKKAAPRDE